MKIFALLFTLLFLMSTLAAAITINWMGRKGCKNEGGKCRYKCPVTEDHIGMCGNVLHCCIREMSHPTVLWGTEEEDIDMQIYI